jgi:hypothetical protein
MVQEGTSRLCKTPVLIYVIIVCKQGHDFTRWPPLLTNPIATLLWPSVGVKPNTPKVGDLESSGTPKCLEFDKKAETFP